MLVFVINMNLVIDIGNTKVKAAVFELDTLKESISFDENDMELHITNLLDAHPISSSIVSSVKKDTDKYGQFFDNLPSLIVLDHQTEVPFENLYKTPETLGIDRIALVSGAVSLYPNKNVLVMDAGTCITYDFVTSDQRYLGGAISPGIDIRYRSLNTFTSKLPRLSLTDDFEITGKTTSEAIHSGVINGLIQEIKGVINQYKEEYLDLTVILTGGDTKFLFKQLKNSIFAHQNFLLYGLNTILTHNNKV